MNKKLLTVCLFAAALPVFGQSYISAADPARARRQVVQKALTYKGVPYAYGGLTTDGIDCSGLIFVCFREATGQNVPRMVKNIFKVAEPLPRNQLQPGDLVFFDTVGPLTHAGIFIGISPDGSYHDAFIHAVSSGKSPGVKITSLSNPYWKKAFSSCGRLLPPASAGNVAAETAPPRKAPSAMPAADAKRDTRQGTTSWEEYTSAEKQRLADSAAHDAAGTAAMDRAWNDRPQKKY